MNMNIGPTVYWHKDQVIIRLKSRLTPGMSEAETSNLRQRMGLKLPGALGVDMQLIEKPLQIHPPANSTDSVDNVDHVFFYRINSHTQPAMASMEGNSGTAGMGNGDLTLALIRQIKSHQNLPEALQKSLQDEGISVDTVDAIDAMPHWLWSATDQQTQGCPISPPIPVEDAGDSGQWKLQFSQLPDTLQKATGHGVTVIVLDTLPEHYQISKAAHRAGSRNMLLQEMKNAIKFKYQPLSDTLEAPTSERPVTGKDLYGRHVGFRMEDHGLFVAGIVHDLAPNANIECIRVLNDFGVGNVCTLLHALDDIHKRMSANNETHEVGDLHNKPVVINMSLVVLPPEDDIPDELAKDSNLAEYIKSRTLSLLYQKIHSLACLGTVFVAPAGNDSDPRMNASEKRFGPRYPAALAYDNPAIPAMIPVGAVNRNGDAAMYSNYPGRRGIATYGGDIPLPKPPIPSAMSHAITQVDTTRPIDALCGVFSAAQYPALSKNDPMPEGSVPNSNAWAYWSGTSFATPIISALAARILQGKEKSVDVRQAIIDVATDETMWTEVEDGKDVPGPMIMAVQEWQSKDISIS